MLLVAAMHKKDSSQCRGIEINIAGVDNNYFVDKTDILNSIKAIEKDNPVGKPIGSFNLKMLEKELEKDIWVKSAELFFDNNEILRVNVHEREPVARVFTATGTTFYTDRELTMLPLSDKFSARLPVFTGFPSDKKVLSGSDSSLLKAIKTISLAIQQDTFLMAMIEQVDITADGNFEMIPKIGNQVIVFGNGEDVEEKLSKLQLFYKEVMVQAGWNSYSVINVQYKNQVVAKRKDAADIEADAQRTLQIMKMIAEQARKQANDSLQIIQPDTERNSVDSSMIQQSIQRDDSAQPSYTFEKPKPQEEKSNRTVSGTAVRETAKKDVKPVQKTTEQPKAVMPGKNDY